MQNGRGYILGGNSKLSIYKMPGGKKEEYDVIGDIGSGSFGVCQKVRRKSDRKVQCGGSIIYINQSMTQREFVLYFYVICTNMWGVLSYHNT